MGGADLVHLGRGSASLLLGDLTSPRGTARSIERPESWTRGELGHFFDLYCNYCIFVFETVFLLSQKQDDVDINSETEQY